MRLALREAGGSFCVVLFLFYVVAITKLLCCYLMFMCAAFSSVDFPCVLQIIGS